LGEVLAYGRLPTPGATVGRDGEGLDSAPIRTVRVAGVLGQSGQLGVELTDPGQPLVVGHLAATHGSQPISGRAGDRQLEPAAGDQFTALVAEPRRMHGELGVVSVGGDEFLALAATPASVPRALDALHPHDLRLHVPLVAGQDVTADEGLPQADEFAAEVR